MILRQAHESVAGRTKHTSQPLCLMMHAHRCLPATPNIAEDSVCMHF